ncbi:DUF4157 domain-containing protein [Pseudoduganella flava]|nr:DUF4157 domain-containing protein [Pseudoduganella flava]
MGAGQCSECAGKHAWGQRKADAAAPGGLRIGAADDPLEHEADRVADQVLAGPAPDVIGGAAPGIQRAAHHALAHQDSAPASVASVIAGAGAPLDGAVRQDMEQRFGHDFSGVRVHAGSAAAQSARDVHARAYTVGNHLVFGAGQFAPQTQAGRRLLAHELTHVIQQDGGADLVQRAEVDDRSCAGLTDIESDIDTKVNAQIAAARTAAAKPMVVADFLDDVAGRLGGKFMGSIEKFIKALPKTKRTDPAQDLSGTKFAGVESVNRFYQLHTQGVVGVVGPAANVKSICMGADKLGHFFEEGFIYFQLARAGGTKAQLESTGRYLEISAKQGLGVTGVYSNADMAANMAGKQFYTDLEADPAGYTFKIANYITKQWNEAANPSFYAASEGSVIWSNLLTGKWLGAFTSGGGKSAPIDAKVDLVATPAGTVTGTAEWPAAKPTNKEKIKNGKITQRTTAVTGTLPTTPPDTLSADAVSGVSITYEWEGKSSKGKGKWDSVDEQNLTGVWGIGKSMNNGGTWRLKKA